MSDETFRWQLVDDFVSAFNQHRAMHFYPSGIICVDESMVRWYGLGGHWISEGLPHYVSIDRKPEDGCEIQNACCAETGIMCRLKIVKTSEESDRIVIEATNNDEERQPRAQPNVGTRVVLELTEPWHSTNRIICADSAFSSVNTAV